MREALLEAVYASPDDELPRLVLADWLEENGEDRVANNLRWWAYTRPTIHVKWEGEPVGRDELGAWTGHMWRLWAVTLQRAVSKRWGVGADLERVRCVVEMYALGVVGEKELSQARAAARAAAWAAWAARAAAWAAANSAADSAAAANSAAAADSAAAAARAAAAAAWAAADSAAWAAADSAAAANSAGNLYRTFKTFGDDHVRS